MPPLPRRLLLGSRWTSRADLDGSTGERHFEVVAVGRARPGGDEPVTLRAVLTRRQYVVARTTLADPDRWASGWQRLP